MNDLAEIERRLRIALELAGRPVAVAFCEVPPSGVAKFTGSEPSGCSFWRLAAKGRSFYTVPADHYNCPVGSYTHNVPLPMDRAGELDATLSFMTGLGYLRMEEIPTIPRLAKSPAMVVYAPLGDAPVPPDVVLFAGRPGKLMLLQEAALRAGASALLPLLGRPTCMAIPAALASGVVLSAGCIGSRVYTDVGEDELYVAIPYKDLARIVAALDTIVAANTNLAAYHRDRRANLASE
jgi:uncharacterized protein (DUF169 family)